MKRNMILILFKKSIFIQKNGSKKFFTMKYEKLNNDKYINISKLITKFFSYYNELGDIIIFEDETNSFISRFIF